MAEDYSIPRQLAHITTRIECISINGNVISGTGFFFLFKHDGKTFAPAIITNKHVLDRIKKATLFFTKKDDNNNPIIGETIPCEMQDYQINKYTINHPDPKVDLAALFIGELISQAAEYKKPLYYIGISKEMIPSADKLKNLSALEEIIMVGYPIGIWDHVNNMPIFRKGITATHPSLDYQGRKEFLVDAACFPGSSGSPVFRYKEGLKFSATGPIKVTGGGPQLELLGILYAGPQMSVEGVIKIVNIPTKQVPLSESKIPINIGYVIKAERLFEIESLIDNTFADHMQKS